MFLMLFVDSQRAGLRQGQATRHAAEQRGHLSAAVRPVAHRVQAKQRHH